MVKTTQPKDSFMEIERIGNHCAIVRINPIEDGEFYLCDELIIRMTEDNKGQEIAKLIKINYPNDTMEAIRNNMDAVRDGLVESAEKAEEYRSEYLAMQAWRSKAKEIVEKVMKLG